MIFKKIYQKPADNWKNILSFVVWYIYSQYRYLCTCIKWFFCFFGKQKKNPQKTLELIQATALDKKENEDAKKNMEKELIQSGLGPAFLGFAFCAKGEDIPLIPF